MIDPATNRVTGGHWGALSRLVLFIVLLGLLSVPAVAGGKVDANEAYHRAQAGDLLIVDVRSPREWQETGLPAGAAAVTIHNPDGAQGFLREMLAAVEGDRSRPVALICARGSRSDRARRFLEAEGFTNVQDVSEGMLGRGDQPGWLARGLPTQPCGTC